MSTQATWGVEEEKSGLRVAQGSAPSTDAAAREAAHYAMQYVQDGPVRWWVKEGRKTVFRGNMQRMPPREGASS